MLFVSLACLALAGCSSVTQRQVLPLDQFPRVYVERRLNDNHYLDEVLVAELRQLGFEASSGPRTLLPPEIDAVMTYDAKWAWDFKTYLTELTLEVHTYPAGKKLADSQFTQRSLFTKAPPEVVRVLLKSLCTKK